MVTDEDLERWVAHEDWEQLVAGVSGLEEDRRRALAASANAIATSLITGQRYGGYRRFDELPERLARHLPADRAQAYVRPGRDVADPYRYEELRRMHAVATLAEYACGDARRMKYSHLYDHLEFFEPALVTILDDRRPTWLAEWLDAKLARDVKDQVITWAIVRGLVRRGACARPTSDGYIRLLASPWTAAALRADLPDRTPFTLVREDPELLEFEVWRLFEVDTYAFRPNPYTIPGWSWIDTFARLAGEGSIDRGRLIDTVLDAVGAPHTRKPALAKLVELHTALAVTPAEREARATKYAALLVHANPAVAKAATKLQRSKRRQAT